MGKINLWIDDVRLPPAEFNVWAKDAESAITIIETGQVDFISFDHDLAPEHYVTKFDLEDYETNRGAATGYDVAKVIERLAYEGKIKPIRWQVHSQNPAGAKNIESAMKQAEKFWERID